MFFLHSSLKKIRTLHGLNANWEKLILQIRSPSYHWASALFQKIRPNSEALNTITSNLWPAWNSWKKKKTIQVKLFYIATCITYVYWKWVHLALWQTKGNKLKCRGCTYQHKKNTNNEVRNKKKDCLKKLLCQKLKS